MQWSEENARIDLAWYFQSAPSECGIRSTQAGFEAQMDARSMTGKQDWTMMHVRGGRGAPKLSELPEDFDSFLERAQVDLSRLAPITRARGIYLRLSTLNERSRRVLEAQFGCSQLMGDVALSLCCLVPTARKGHLEALRETRDYQSRKLADQERRARLGHHGRPKPTPKVKNRAERRMTGGSTVGDYLLSLCVIEDGRAVLDAILEEARTELRRAMAAYVEAGRKAA